VAQICQPHGVAADGPPPEIFMESADIRGRIDCGNLILQLIYDNHAFIVIDAHLGLRSL
jgi:hypothetical protein